MAVQPTDLPGQAGFTQSIPIVPAPAAAQPELGAQLRGYVAAFAAAEHVLATSPVLPTSVTVEGAPWASAPTVRPYFHNGPASVRAFGERFGCEVSEQRRGRDVYTAATGMVHGVAFEAWSLTFAGEDAA